METKTTSLPKYTIRGKISRVNELFAQYSNCKQKTLQSSDYIQEADNTEAEIRILTEIWLLVGTTGKSVQPNGGGSRASKLAFQSSTPILHASKSSNVSTTSSKNSSKWEKIQLSSFMLILQSVNTFPKKKRKKERYVNSLNGRGPYNIM